MLKNVGENIKKNFALIFFYTLDIRNIIFNPKYYQHFLPSLLVIRYLVREILFTCKTLTSQCFYSPRAHFPT